jgi:transposase
MQKLPKPESTAEFKEQAVKEGTTVGAAAKEMGLVEPTLRHGVKASHAGKRDGAWHPEADAGGDGTVAPAR